MSLFAPGFSGEKFALTVALNRTLFPIILFTALAAVSMGVLNAQGSFFVPQSATTFFNITSIVAGVTLATIFAPEYMGPLWQSLGGGTAPPASGVERAIAGMAVGTLLGGVALWVGQVPQLVRLGFAPRLTRHWPRAELVRIFKLTGPAILAGSAVQVSVLINTYFATSLGHGSVSYLAYAFRLMQFPLGLFGVVYATAAAPDLARWAASGQFEAMRLGLKTSLRMSLFLSLPATVGMIVLVEPIVTLIYQHGRFGGFDALGTIYALLAYALGISSYALIKIYQPAFLAFHDARVPMRVALASIVSNIVISWVFVHVLGWPHWGLALATTLTAALNVLLLALCFRHKLPGVWQRADGMHVLKVLLASLAMGIVTWKLTYALEPVFGGPGLLSRVLWVMVPMAVAIPIYFGVSLIFGVKEAKLLFSKLLKTQNHS